MRRLLLCAVPGLIVGLSLTAPARSQETTPSRRPKVAISACLLGQKTRYDGGHKHQPAIVARLQQHVDLVPICPERWLGIPRPPIRLERGSDGGTRLIMPSTGRDLTAQMQTQNARLLEELDGQGIAGCVLKASSPTCGVGSTKLHGPGSVISTQAHGTFAARLHERWGFPLADERQLLQQGGVERFVEQVLRYARQGDGSFLE